MDVGLRRRAVAACLACAVGVVLVLAGCSASGPTRRELLSAGSQADASFALIEVSDATLDRVSVWHRPSLSAIFGDYRAPVVQRVEVGDVVQVSLWEAGGGAIFASATLNDARSVTPRASAIPDQVVASEGTITVPYAGRVKVAGLTPHQVEDIIVKQLTGKVAQPQAVVTVTKNVSQSVTVTGDVTSGARIPLSARGDRVLDVIASAGGVKAAVHEAFVTLSRDGSSLSVPLQTLLAHAKENVYVRPNDVITVYRAPQSFTAVGATGRQALVPFDAGGLTLEEALGKAGGLLDDRADPAGVFVLRYEPVELVKGFAGVPDHLMSRAIVPVAYWLNMRNAEAWFRARKFAMHDKDILYVSHAPITEVEKIVRIFSTLTSPAASGASIYYGIH